MTQLPLTTVFNSDLELDGKYGLDFQEIHFKPNCDKPINNRDIIVSEIGIRLFCVGKDTFRLLSTDSRDFVTGYELLSSKFSSYPNSII